MTSQVWESLSFISFHLYTHKKYLLIMSIQTFLRHTWIILNTFEIWMFSIRHGMCLSLDHRNWIKVDMLKVWPNMETKPKLMNWVLLIRAHFCLGLIKPWLKLSNLFPELSLGLFHPYFYYHWDTECTTHSNFYQ